MDTLFIKYKKMLKELGNGYGIPVNLFVQQFKPCYSNLIIIYFTYLDGLLQFDDFFQFICFYLFFKYENMIPIFLSMCGIQSNIFICIDQIKTFFNHMGIVSDVDVFINSIESEMNCKVTPSGKISLKLFYDGMNKETVLLNDIISLKEEISMKFFEISDYYRISNRIFYYYNYGRLNNSNESCLFRMKKCFKGYHNNKNNKVKPINPDRNALLKTLHKYRGLFGYSFRHSSLTITPVPSKNSTDHTNTKKCSYMYSFNNSKSNNRFISVSSSPDIYEQKVKSI